MSETGRKTRTTGKKSSRETRSRRPVVRSSDNKQERYRSLFENVPISLWEEDFSRVKIYVDDLRSQGIEDFRGYFEDNFKDVVSCVEMVRITDVNQAALKLCEAGSKEELLKGLAQIYTEDTYDAFKEQLIALAEGETSFEKERLIRTLKGNNKHVHLTLSVAPGYRDNWARVLLSVTDITPRKMMEEELKSNHEYLQRLNDSLEEVIFRIILPERTIAYINHAIESVFGYEEDECLGKTTEIIYPSRTDYLNFGKMLENTILEGKDALHAEIFLKRKNGELFPAEVNTTFLKDNDVVTGIISILRDVTRRQKAEEGLRISKARLTEAQRIAHLGNWEWDVVTGDLLWSDEIFRIFGLSPGQFGATHESFMNSVHPEDKEFVERSINEALYEGLTYDINHRIIQLDGSIRTVHEKAEVIYNDTGQPLRMIGTIHDITELKRAEEELRALSRSLVHIQEEERRNIARELHDEIGQSLTVLKLLLDRIKRNPAENIASILGEGEALLNGLMSQVRSLSLELRPGMLDDLGLLPTLLWYFDNYTNKTNIKVNFKHSGLQIRFHPEVRVAAYRIIQEALTNVLRHAGVTEVDLAVWLDRGILWIRVQDEGNGFDTTIISPGTSGGLFGMHERARSLGGEVTIDTRTGIGTTIIARLPLPCIENDSKGEN